MQLKSLKRVNEIILRIGDRRFMILKRITQFPKHKAHSIDFDRINQISSDGGIEMDVYIDMYNGKDDVDEGNNQLFINSVNKDFLLLKKKHIQKNLN